MFFFYVFIRILREFYSLLEGKKQRAPTTLRTKIIINYMHVKLSHNDHNYHIEFEARITEQLLASAVDDRIFFVSSPEISVIREIDIMI